MIATVLAVVMGGQAFADDIHISLFPNSPDEVRIHGKTVDYSNDDDFSLVSFSGEDRSVRVVPKDRHNNQKFVDLIEYLKEQPGKSFPGTFKRNRQAQLRVRYFLQDRTDQLMVEVDGVNYYISKRFRGADSDDYDDN